MHDASKLADWKEIQGQRDWRGLLMGNGASIAVSSKFRYASLFEEAALPDASEKLFELEDTTNFELILRRLQTAYRVCGLLDIPQEKIQRQYAAIRKALVRVVKDIHPRQYKMKSATKLLSSIHSCARQYEAVFSTNYDLLLYWSMALKFGAFYDFFRGSDVTFHPDNVQKRNGHSADTEVYWLHGGLHLYRTPDGTEGKFRSKSGNRLLDNPDDTGFAEMERAPLFVAEGTAEQKRQSIRRSAYLSMALEQLEEFAGPLVVFGSSLQDADQNLIEAIAAPEDRTIAVSLYPDADTTALAHRMATIENNLGRPERIQFFDSTTHPLGDEKMNIDGENPPTGT